jgi:hypothetical protein
LGIRFDSIHESAFNTYVAFYNWASFPVDWTKIQALEWRSVRFAEDVGYAIRCVRKIDDRGTRDVRSAGSPSQFTVFVATQPDVGSSVDPGGMVP